MFVMFSEAFAMAEERSIFVGDLINIKISAQSFSENELREKFKDFEIVNIKQDSEDYFVSLRSFDPLEKTIILGSKELKITIKSTLNEIKRDAIFDGNLNPQEPSFTMNWQVVFFILLFLFVVTGGIFLWNLKNKRKNLQLSPFKCFNKQIGKIAFDDELYFVKLTLALKEYLESRYSCCIKEKTSNETIEELKYIPELKESIFTIKCWLEENDYYKFTGVTTGMDKKKELLERLIDIVTKIDMVKEETV